METAVAEDNALTGSLAYILPASMYGALKTATKDSGSGQFVVEPDGNINGYRAIVSNQVTAGDLYFGNFADLLVGFYGGLDLTVDTAALATSGGIRVIASANDGRGCSPCRFVRSQQRRLISQMMRGAALVAPQIFLEVENVL